MYAIYGNIYHQYTHNVSIYTSTMDPIGYKKQHYVGWLWRLPHGSTDFPPSSDGYGKQQTCLTVGFAGQDLNLCVLFFELSAHFTGMLDSRRLVNLNHIEFPCSTGVP